MDESGMNDVGELFEQDHQLQPILE